MIMLLLFLKVEGFLDTVVLLLHLNTSTPQKCNKVKWKQTGQIYTDVHKDCFKHEEKNGSSQKNPVCIFHHVFCIV